MPKSRTSVTVMSLHPTFQICPFHWVKLDKTLKRKLLILEKTFNMYDLYVWFNL